MDDNKPRAQKCEIFMKLSASSSDYHHHMGTILNDFPISIKGTTPTP
jgi:hypothetical protein